MSRKEWANKNDRGWRKGIRIGYTMGKIKKKRLNKENQRTEAEERWEEAGRDVSMFP